MSQDGLIVPDWQHVDYVVLDMDGTLLDLHFDNQVWNVLLPRRYAEQYGLDEDTARVAISERLSARRGTLPWYCLDHWKAQLGIEIDALEGELAGLIRERPGAVDFLRWLTAQGIHCILATNAHPRSLERKLELTGIGRHFDAIVSAHEIGCAKEGAAFWRGLTAQTGLVPERTLLVDDNHAVLSAARTHGLAHLYGVAWPDSQGQRVSGEFPCLEAFTALMAPGSP